MNILVTNRHFTRGIELASSNKFSVCDLCVLAQAVKDIGYEMIIIEHEDVYYGYLPKDRDGFSALYTIDEAGQEIARNFDSHIFYSPNRQALPFTPNQVSFERMSVIPYDLKCSVEALCLDPGHKVPNWNVEELGV